MTPRRLRQLETLQSDRGTAVFIARTPRARLLGLALLGRPPPGCILLIPRCRSVHTVAMLFAIDVVFLGASGRALKVLRDVGPGRFVSCRGAVAVLELPAGGRDIIPFVAEERNRLLEALDPRVPIYRDTYNEYFMLLLSAGGAVAGTQVPLYIIMAITGLWGLVPFVAACIVFELVVIFGLARPQMKPHERVGWVLLWSFTTGVLAVCFYELVAKPTL